MPNSLKTLAERSSFFLLLAIMFILPLPLGSNRPWAWSIFQVLIGASALLTLVYCSADIIKTRIRNSAPLLDVLVLTQVFVVFQLLPVLHGKAFSFDTAQTQVALLKGVAYCLFVWCCFIHLYNKQRVQVFVYVIIATVALQAFYAIYLQFSGADFTPFLGSPINSQRASGTFVYHNHLANYLLLGGALAIGVLIGQLNRSHSSNWRRQMVDFFNALLSAKWLLRVAIICIVIALILTRSRMGNSAFLVSLLATAVLALLVMKRPPKMLKWLLISFVVIDIALVGAMFGVEKVKERIDSTSFQGETRDDVVVMSIPLIQDHWFSGTGAGTFYTAFPAYHQGTLGGLYDHAHNEYVQFSVEYGILFTAFLGLTVLYCLYSAFSALRRRKDPFYQGIAFGCIMAIVGMLMHISVDFPLQATANTVTFIAILMLALIANKQTKTETDNSTTTTRWTRFNH